MDWFLLVIAVFASFGLQSDAKPLVLDADYSDDDLVAEETRAFAHASASVNGGAFASASSGFGGQPFYDYYEPPPFFPHPDYGYPPPPPPPPFPGQQRPFRRPNGRGKHKNPHRHMPWNKPFRQNNNRRPHPPPWDDRGPAVIAPVPDFPQQPSGDDRAPEVIAPVPNNNPQQQEVIPTATPTSLPPSSVAPPNSGSTSSTTEEPFYDIDVRIAN